MSSDYLAKYLTADPVKDKKSKKRKRKDVQATGLIIADDDLTGWDNQATANDADDDPMMVASGGRSSTSQFRKSKTNNWKVVGVAAPKDNDQAAADRIIEQAALENRERAQEAEDAPVVENTEDVDMDDGPVMGLQTGAQVAAAMKKKKKAEEREMKEAREEAAKNGGGETIYRDASGRIINVAMKRAEARKKAEDEARQKIEEAEAAKGDAQRAMKDARKQELEDAKYMNLARTADDVEMNEELKERDRWNDPAAMFVTKKKKGKSSSGKPLYQGSFKPNRYGIRPGHRWDGVDRGNGFEDLWFKARNKVKNREALEYAWQMDE